MFWCPADIARNAILKKLLAWLDSQEIIVFEIILSLFGSVKGGHLDLWDPFNISCQALFMRLCISSS